MTYQDEQSDLPRLGIKDDFDEIRFLPWCTEFHAIDDREKSIIKSVLSAMEKVNIFNLKDHEDYSKDYDSVASMLWDHEVEAVLLEKKRAKIKDEKKKKKAKVSPDEIREEMWRNYDFLINQAKALMSRYHLTEGGEDMMFDADPADELRDLIEEDKKALADDGVEDE